MNSICIIREPVKEYPDKAGKFRPSQRYPEYLFEGEISSDENIVYDMIRRDLKCSGWMPVILKSRNGIRLEE